MSETSRIQHQLRYAFEGPAWHGPAVNEILEGMSASQAALKPAGAPHSVWELIRHIAAWLDAVRVRLGGEALELTDAQDWPRVRATAESDWTEAQENLRRAYSELHAAIGEITDRDLERVAAGRSYNNYFMLHGVIQHTLYHAGQVIVLKRMAESNQP